MNIDQARRLAVSLSEIMPSDPVRKAQWIHAVRCVREILRDELPLMDVDAWEALCYPDRA